jgi:hypothetical protein
MPFSTEYDIGKSASYCMHAHQGNVADRFICVRSRVRALTADVRYGKNIAERKEEIVSPAGGLGASHVRMRARHCCIGGGG